jgi:hypothetical protein
MMMELIVFLFMRVVGGTNATGNLVSRNDTRLSTLTFCQLLTQTDQNWAAARNSTDRKNQQQILQPKQGQESVSTTQQSTTKCSGFSTAPRGNCGTEPTLLPPKS